MAIVIQGRRSSLESIGKRYQDAIILDVTSHGAEPWVRFSPFYPHGNIPVPFSEGYVSATVEGIWQGLKVFVGADVDISKFEITRMKGIKRSARVLGNVLGHREGVNGEDLLNYREARYAIYLPAYRWVLEHCLQKELDELKRLSVEEMLVLLDYETNGNVDNTARPLSHAGLIKRYVEGDWPQG